MHIQSKSMSTEQIKLNPDGTVYRGEKHIATVKDGGDIDWKHWTFKKKHGDELGFLLMGEGFDKPEDAPAPVKAPAKSDPAPAMDFRGDRTPGYPEWFLKQNGQEAYTEKYQVRGVNRYPEKEAADYPRANGSDTADKERNKPLNQ